MTTPNEGVNDYEYGSDEAAVASLMSRWADAEKLSEDGEGETADDTDEGDEDAATVLGSEVEDESDEGTDGSDDADADQNEDADDDEQDDDDGSKAVEANDDQVVRFTVDGEERTVSVKELKRLAGQEAALTRKSQEVANARKQAEADAQRYMLATGKMLEAAQKRLEPFQKIDWLVAQQRLNADEFAALRAEAREALEHYNFLTNESAGVLAGIQQERQAALREQAKEAIKVLEADVPGWNQELYNQVCEYAVQAGMDAEMVRSVVDPVAIKLMHDAMRYRQMQDKARAKKTIKKAAPKKPLKPSAQNSVKLQQKQPKGTDALKRLKATGSDEDAVAYFLSNWADQRDD